MRKILIMFMVFSMILLSACSLVTDKSKPVYNEDSHLENRETDEKSGSSQNKIDKPAANVSGTNTASSDSTDEKRYTTFYYQDKDGLIIPVTRKTDRVEGIAKAAILSLVDIPVIREDIGRVGLYPVLPAGTHINGMTIKDGTAVVDFNEQVLNYTSEKDKAIIMNSIAYTLTEFDTINSVQLLINSNSISSYKTDDTIDMPLRRSGINVLDDAANDIGETKEPVEVYFVKLINNKYMYYVPVTKYIHKPSSDFDRYTRTLNELIKGEVGESNLNSYIPKDAALKGVQVEGQTVILNFNEEILSSTASDVGFNTMLNQIGLCFRQFGKVKNIKILVNGKALEFTGDNKGKESLDVPVYVNRF
ncbi:GerMN domain-containing protein [Petroclostridium sp. X23]|uniref:GerMN domain-containing protein n=1 Tax=Petroclostridium sp. X23 TaxID=3045146 RepID=UPI0024AD99A0|nr:GerMN domain-containing protein [Petroclostridium sp. X23]WHH60530.1 GerMN domain-containing protein [Petroclostridium sp. X23]